MKVIRSQIWPGAAKPEPFLILAIKNPVLETAGTYDEDPVQRDSGSFRSAAHHLAEALAGRLPRQAEPAFIDPAFLPEIRFEQIEIEDPIIDDLCAFVGHRWSLLEPRQLVIAKFLKRENILADVAFVISGSPVHTRASAYYTYDNEARSGVRYTYAANGGERLGYHRRWPRIPGVAALHVTEQSLTAVHEFGHAISSYENGQIVDLYVDKPLGLNKRVVRPPPGGRFTTYASGSGAAERTFQWDPARTCIGYAPAWKSFHCEAAHPTYPAIMDNYWLAPGGDSVACRHDEFTRDFIRDRVAAKLGRS